jgi:hypothetical protein
MKSKLGYLLILSTLLLTSCGKDEAAFELLTDGQCSSDQAAGVSAHISAQIDAIANQDWQRAYQYAAPSFQEAVSQSRFIEIIKTQYQMIIENQGIEFTSCKIADSKIYQVLLLTATDSDYELIYRIAFENGRLGVEAATAAPVKPAVRT